ncbi:MAG: hypothetical protein RLY31_1756 [Bacteroidota bacterium]
MNKRKIFNDPVYGFVTIPYDLLFDLVEHPWFQRLRRIKQVSLSNYVYPGASHTRFQHALGAMHLMGQAIEVLRSKGVDISEEEAMAVSVAILLHDIGHGPFSHTLEHTLINVPHEALSLCYMERLNEVFGGALSQAIRIFRNEHPRPFLHQLVSGQLDMDRMDYLNRDSFFTGVSEGVIGYDRIIKMLSVKDGGLVVEEKGMYSIEKFLVARRLMYWQVYLHKTVLVAERMLVKALQRARELAMAGVALPVWGGLRHFLYNEVRLSDFHREPDLLLELFSSMDDYDIVAALKGFRSMEDPVLSLLAGGLLDRRLFRIELRAEPFGEEERTTLLDRIPVCMPGFGRETAEYLVFGGVESNHAYSTAKDEINILFKDGRVLPMSRLTDFGLATRPVTKHYLCYPKVLAPAG